MPKSWRALVAILTALPMAAGITAASAHPTAKPVPKPSPSAFASVTLSRTSVTQTGCDLTLTYTWQGFRRIWRYGISIYSGSYPSADWVATYGAQTPGSGQATLTYTMQPGTEGTFYGKGTLWTAADNLVSGSYKTTSDLSFSCPTVAAGVLS